MNTSDIVMNILNKGVHTELTVTDITRVQEYVEHMERTLLDYRVENMEMANMLEEISSFVADVQQRLDPTSEFDPMKLPFHARLIVAMLEKKLYDGKRAII